MNDEERMDIIEGTDEDGNKLLLRVEKYFFFNGEEYVLLCDGCDCEDCAHEHEHGGEHEAALYVMKVEVSNDEDGEEIEEFVPVDEDLMDKLIEAVEQSYLEEDEEELDDDDD